MSTGRGRRIRSCMRFVRFSHHIARLLWTSPYHTVLYVRRVGCVTAAVAPRTT